MRRWVTVSLSAVLLIALPVAGLVGGGYVVLRSAPPEEPHCGLWVLPLLLGTVFAALAGMAIGAGVAWVLALGLFRRANGCGLGDAPNDPPWWNNHEP